VYLTPKACCLAILLSTASAAAQDVAPEPEPPAPLVQAIPADLVPQMKRPNVSRVEVDWDAVRAALADVAPLVAGHHPGAGKTDPVSGLNEAAKKIFPKIDVSPVPVLLPFDTSALLRDEAAGTAIERDNYLSGLHASRFFFFPGPSGYDAALSLQAQDNPALGISAGRRVDVQISGSALIYELDVPSSSEGKAVPELESQFPGIRRLVVEDHLRYTFVLFGVPYFLTVSCVDQANRFRPSCRDADKVGVRFLKALTIAGGEPEHHLPAQAAKARAGVAPQTIERPAPVSADFTYYAAGDILPGTGMRGQAGRADPTVYSKIRFPMEEAPAYVNSQTFMNWGGCDFTGRVALGGHGKSAAYRCRVNGIPLVQDESKNYAYPWRDNFCEHRYFSVGQCPAGLGHQGEDVRPGSCKLRNGEADRCEPYQHNIVAVRDGVVLRGPGDEALYLVVDAPGEHIRFRYLHMDPRLLDGAGMVSGRALSEGEVIGTADNYERRQGGTTYHLHFDVQVPTRAGWVFVSPYMTLVASYERLIGARGVAVGDTPPATVSANAIGAPGVYDEHSAEDSRKAALEQRRTQTEHCQAGVSKGHRRRHCRIDVAEGHERARRGHAVRWVGRRFSHESHGPRHHGGNVHTRHARGASRHGRA
jgi:hypothetical protein